MRGEPIEVTRERVGDQVEVTLYNWEVVKRKLREDRRGLFIYNVGLRIPVRHGAYYHFLQSNIGIPRKERVKNAN